MRDLYSKVLIELDKKQAIRAQQNNLIKIQYETEDYELRKRIVEWCNILNIADVHVQRKACILAKDLLNSHSDIKQELRDYCTSCIQSRQPEWQILALRYEWTPPIK